MGIVFLTLFGLFSLLHLISSWKNDRISRAKTKPFLISSLALAYLFSAEDPSMLLLAALVTSWLGDVLLIPRGNRWVILGGISFLGSHFLLMGLFLHHIHFAAVPWFHLLPVVAIYALLSVISIRGIWDNTPKLMLLAFGLYLLTNSGMNLLALMQLLTSRHPGAAVSYAGAVLFFLSDCILLLVRYHRNPDLVPKKHFPVMLCYLSGEFLITLGIFMMA